MPRSAIRAWLSVACLAAAGLSGAGAVAASPGAFTTPVVAIPTAPGSTNEGYGTGGEPRMLVTKDGRILVAAHMSQWDCVTGRPTPGQGHQCVWTSRDGGRHFRFSGGELNQQGDDVDLAESGGVLLESTMTNRGIGTGFLGTTVSRSTDGGRTWTEQVAANSTLINDRPFMLAMPDGGVVVTFDAMPGGIQLVRSTDHGATWGLPQSVAIPTGSGPVIAINGAPGIDRKHRRLLVPVAVANSPCASAASGCFNELSLATGAYDGTGWRSEHVLTLPEDMGATSLVSAAADSAGAAYVSAGTALGGSATAPATHGAHVQLLTQRGAGPWSMRQVDPPGGSAMVPNLVAGSAGRVVVTYYWSPYPDAQSVARPWYVVVADSHDSGRTFTRTTLSKVVWVGSAAQHQLVLWDLFGTVLDPKGKLHVAWTQVSRMTADGPLTEIAYSRQR